MPKILLSLLILCSITTGTFAQVETGLPRFATIKSNQVNARSGPGNSYPIEWIFVSKGEPIKIIAEFEQWRKVEDIDEQGGWIHSSVLSPKRSVIVVGSNIQKLFSQDNAKSRLIAKIEPGLRCIFDKCRDNNWCKIKCDGYKGWIDAKSLWGVQQRDME